MPKTVHILEIFFLVINVFTILFLVMATWLFGNAYTFLNEYKETYMCILYLSPSNQNPSNSTCDFAIAGEVLAVLGLVCLEVLSIAKLVSGITGDKTLFVIGITILLISGVFALTSAIVLSSGWGVTCDKNNDLSTIFDSNYDYLIQITTSVVFAAFAVAAIVGSSIIYIITFMVESCTTENAYLHINEQIS